jgi:hypothetical protein
VKHILRNEKGKVFDVLKYQCNKEGCDWSDWDDSGKCAWRDLENPDLCDCDEAIIEALKGVIRQARADLAYLKEADDQ